MTVGIERLAAYVPQYALRMTELAAARGVPPEKLTAGLGVQEMAIAPPCEDVVTLAASAGARLLRAAQIDPGRIGMLLVATETGVDHSKPVSIFVHDLLGIGPRCRVYELKHACYAGTAALMAAADWVRAGGLRARRALVIATDIARYTLGSPGEPTQGNTYTASLYLGLAGLLESEGKALAARIFIDVDEYERVMRSGEAGGEPPAGFAGEFVFAGVRSDRRVYARPRALAA